jgi:hypothetical protein
VIHFDRARQQATDVLKKIVAEQPSIQRSVLIDDIFGKIRAIVWLTADSEKISNDLSRQLSEAAGEFWAGDLWVPSGVNDPQNTLYEAAWTEGTRISEKLRRADRLRSKAFWINPPQDPVWENPEPPVILFYSFKGGVGRTTALASFAIQKARAGDRIVVVDLDVEAPGIGTLLDAGEGIAGAQWGVVDYLIESPVLSKVPDLRDYYHACAREPVTGVGEILVFPAGTLNEDFLTKLSRVDLEPASPPRRHPLVSLLDQIRVELNPTWILLDSRSGLSEASGFVSSGLAHLHVLFGTSSEQSWLGLRVVLHQLGAEQIRRDRPQLDCILVHALVPPQPLRESVEKEFRSRAEDEFRDNYFASDPSEPDMDGPWYVRDMTDDDAPHVPVALPWDISFAVINRIDDAANDLAISPAYIALAERITDRFASDSTEEE